jgi:GntR family transcriptional regulator / MocR family aminotransferase
MDLVLRIDASLKGTLQDQIYSEIRNLIATGRLNSGDRLPAIRELSAQLKVARNTVALAYERLAMEGFVAKRLFREIRCHNRSIETVG